MEFLVYKIINNVNGKFYVGCTTSGLVKRFNDHKSRCRNGYKSKLCNAINKYGVENFDFIVLEKCETPEQMFNREVYYIDKYDTKNGGYNLTNGGEGCVGYVHNEKTKNLLSKYFINNHPHKEKVYDEIYGDKAELEKEKRSISLKKYWSNLDEDVKKSRVNKTKESMLKNGVNKCGKNPFSKKIIVDGQEFGCWSEAEKKLGVSKYKIKKYYKYKIG